jgi:hypothetical protein
MRSLKPDDKRAAVRAAAGACVATGTSVAAARAAITSPSEGQSNVGTKPHFPHNCKESAMARNDGDWSKPSAMAIPKEGQVEYKDGNYGPVFSIDHVEAASIYASGKPRVQRILVDAVVGERAYDILFDDSTIFATPFGTDKSLQPSWKRWATK